MIDNNKYQVFLCCVRLPIPLNFAVHSYFVVNLKGEVHRWEFGLVYENFFKFKLNMFKDFLDPFEGLGIFLVNKKLKFKPRVIDYIEGDNNSVANSLGEFIQNNSLSYPLIDKYVLIGPNSNTYIQWVLDHFPESNFKLP